MKGKETVIAPSGRRCGNAALRIADSVGVRSMTTAAYGIDHFQSAAADAGGWKTRHSKSLRGRPDLLNGDVVTPK